MERRTDGWMKDTAQKQGLRMAESVLNSHR